MKGDIVQRLNKENGIMIPLDLAEILYIWLRQVSEQPPHRVAKGIVAVAKQLHYRLQIETDIDI